MKRLLIEVSDKSKKVMDELQSRTGAKTPAEMIANALRLYDFLFDHAKDGWEIELSKGDEYLTLDLDKAFE